MSNTTVKIIIILIICLILYTCFNVPNKKSTNKIYTDINTKKTKTTYIYLVGDSVLDNFYWLKHPTQNLTYQLIKNIDYANTYNYSVDRSVTTDIINGMVPKDMFINARNMYNLQPYPQSEGGYVYPLKLLESSKKKSNKRHIAVLSVGGNDGRVLLPYLIFGHKYAWEQLKKTGFNQNYQDAVKAVKNIMPETVLVLVYRPYKHKLIPDFLYNRMLKMFKEATKIVYKTACKEKLPLIDLTRTMDNNDPSHYGKGDNWDRWDSSPIEPSIKSGIFITNLIKYVIENHNFNGESMVYYGKDKVNIDTCSTI